MYSTIQSKAPSEKRRNDIKKAAGTLAPAAFCLRTGKLLNRDYALHAKREVRSAVIGILAGLDLPE
jgi:hypothetical protein